jgi:hypothetical protein
MLMARSGEARLRMGDSMYATARALVIASILEHDPSASRAALRQAVFTRFYGHELDAATCERILARLADGPPADDPGEPPRGRQAPVDWDDLELALTWHDDESFSVLDLRTGNVRHCQWHAFSDEAEDFELSEAEVDAGEAEGYLVRIEPLASSVEWRWMAAFAESVRDARLRALLDVALGGRGAFRRFKDVLAGRPAERERWFRFRDERLRAAVREWLAEHGIQPTTEPMERNR